MSVFGADFNAEGKVLGVSEISLASNKLKISAEQLGLTAKSAAIIDANSSILLFGSEENEIRPIASITKLMTALVFLDHNPGWKTEYEISREDRREGGKINLFLGEKVTLKDLFYSSLVGSDNSATIALTNSLGFTEEAEFVKKMNDKALELGLSRTHFEDATGLSSKNVSTAIEIAKMGKIAFENSSIREATLTKEYVFTTLAGRKKRIETTDYLLKNFPENGLKINGGKTGYTEAAGYCFAGLFSNKKGEEVISVILGSNDANSRFHESKKLAEWALVRPE